MTKVGYYNYMLPEYCCQIPFPFLKRSKTNGALYGTQSYIHRIITPGISFTNYYLFSCYILNRLQILVVNLNLKIEMEKYIYPVHIKQDFQVRAFRLQKSTYNLKLNIFVQSQNANCSIIILIFNVIQGKQFLIFDVHFLLLSQQTCKYYAFVNACTCISKEHVSCTFDNFRKVVSSLR